MRRALTEAEIGRLLTQLKADEVSPGWLWPLFWRRGWIVPPPLFLPPLVFGVLSAGHWSGCAGILVLSVTVPALWGVLTAIGLVIALYSNPLRDLLHPLIRFALAAGVVALTGNAWFRWLQPITWPGWHILGLLLPVLMLVMWWTFRFTFTINVQRRDAMQLPPWRDYVTNALALEAF